MRKLIKIAERRSNFSRKNSYEGDVIKNPERKLRNIFFFSGRYPEACSPHILSDGTNSFARAAHSSREGRCMQFWTNGGVFEADLWGNFSSRALCGNYLDSFNREDPSHGKVSLSAIRTGRYLNCFTLRHRVKNKGETKFSAILIAKVSDDKILREIEESVRWNLRDEN